MAILLMSNVYLIIILDKKNAHITLKAPITTAADDKNLKHPSKFSIKIRYDIS